MGKTKAPAKKSKPVLKNQDVKIPINNRLLKRMIGMAFANYLPSNNSTPFETGMKLVEKPDDLDKDLIVSVAATQNYSNLSGITLQKSIKLIQYLQRPYTDPMLQRFEQAVRRNWAVRSAIGVREFFVFGKGSKLSIELPDKDMRSKKPEEIQKQIDDFSTKYAEQLANMEKTDKRVRLLPNLRTFYWQNLTFGMGVIIKIFDDPESKDNTIQTLRAINSRRVKDPILDKENQNKFMGMVIDSQGLKKESMIYGAYQDIQLSPHTEHYGYTPLETVAHAAETLTIIVEEDLKEIAKAAWLPTIIMTVNLAAAGITDETAQTELTSLANSVKPGKVMAFGDAITTDKVSMNAESDKIVVMVDKLETIIYKAFQVPLFLVQSESAANFATAYEAAQLFIDGVISSDQKWLSDLLVDQWYDEMLRSELGDDYLEKDDSDNYLKELPFHVRRVFEKAKVQDFQKLVDAVIKLYQGHVIDLQKALEILEMPEIKERVEDANEKAKQEMLQNGLDSNNPQSSDAKDDNDGKPQKPKTKTQVAAEHLAEKTRLLKNLNETLEKKNSK